MMNIATAVQRVNAAVNAAPDANTIFSQLGNLPTKPASTSILRIFATADAGDGSSIAKGQSIFAKFEANLKQAICTDLNYCANQAAISNDIQKIMTAINNELPFTAAVPSWLVTILKWFGIAATSWDTLVVLLTAAAIKLGLSKLCGCN